MSTWQVRETTLETKVINTSLITLNQSYAVRENIHIQPPNSSTNSSKRTALLGLSTQRPKKIPGQAPWARSSRKQILTVRNWPVFSPKKVHWHFVEALMFFCFLLNHVLSFRCIAPSPCPWSHPSCRPNRHEDITLDWRHAACGRTIFLAAFISNLFPQREENNSSSLEWSSWIGMDKHLKHSETAYFESIIPH